MKCPVDNSVLQSQVYEGDVEVDACPSCGGMWLDKEELERIEQTQQRDYTEELKRMPDFIGAAYEMALQKSLPVISCPKCNAEMSKHEYAYCSQIVIDVCPKCQGLWLDKGEIEQLEIIFERSQVETKEIRKGFWSSLITIFQR